MPQHEYSASPQGIYIHIPFCLKKCAYCDFFSLPLLADEELESYTCALLREMDLVARSFSQTQINTIYFGGGTPSLLDATQIERLLQSLRQRFQVADASEITLEANPATLTAGKLEGLLRAGINRLSLGVQSFNDDELRLLGRVHNSRAVLETLELLQRYGLSNYNIDLIYGLPGQSIAKWRKNLEQAADISPPHISLYLLQLDPTTNMGRAVAANQIRLLDEEKEADMYYQGIDFLQAQGYEHYEISNFCRPGRECRHNLLYWQAHEYIGLGAGAVSYAAGRRYRNSPNIEGYQSELECGRSQPVEELERMVGRELVADAIILGLRLSQGIELGEFECRFGVDLLGEYATQISTCEEQGLLELKNGRLSLARAGYFLSNQALCQFMG